MENKLTFEERLPMLYTDRDAIKLLIEEIQELRDMVLDLQDDTQLMKEEIITEREIYDIVNDEVTEAISEHVFVSHEAQGEIDE